MSPKAATSETQPKGSLSIISNNKSTDSKNNAAAYPVKPIRRYTEYNIFFQLEREYILQVELDVKPNLDPSDVFDPERDTDYNGPSLPPRYSGLVLRSDWYVPGKGKRRKRKHVKSHGKISFFDLSSKIANKWNGKDDCIDNETRMFCVRLSDIGMQEYRREMRMYKLACTIEALNAEDKKEEKSAQMNCSDDSLKRQAKKPSTKDVKVHLDDTAVAAMKKFRHKYSKANDSDKKFSVLCGEVLPETQEISLCLPVGEDKCKALSVKKCDTSVEGQVDFAPTLLNYEPQDLSVFRNDGVAVDYNANLRIASTNNNNFFCRRTSNQSVTSIETNMTSASSSTEILDMSDHEILNIWQSSPAQAEHCEHLENIVSVCVDAVSSGNLERLSSVNELYPTSTCGEPSAMNLFCQSTMCQPISSAAEPTMMVPDDAHSVASVGAMKSHIEKEIEEISRLRSLLAQEQNRAQENARRTFSARSA